MAQIIRFFPRQAVVGAGGGGAGNVTLVSDVYEVPDAAQIMAELRLYSFSGAGAGVLISGIIEDAMMPQMSPDAVWRTVTGTAISAATGAYVSGASLQRFVRGKLFIHSAVSGAIVAFEGLTRNAT